MHRLSRPHLPLQGAVTLLSVTLVGCSGCSSRVAERRPNATQRSAAAARSTAAKPDRPQPPAVKRARAWEGAGLQTTSQTGATCTGTTKGVAVLCVSGEGTGPGAGTGDKPFRTVQRALVAAKQGDVVQVEAGTYAENVALRGKTVKLLGGYCPGFKERNPAKCASTLAGQGRDAAVTLFEAGDSTVDGFRITAGTGNEQQKEFYYLGGGIYVNRGAPTISHNLIEDNDIISSHPNPESIGSAIFSENADTSILSNLVRRNRSGRGALGIWSKSRVIIRGNVIRDNVSVGDHGGGLYASGPGLLIQENLVLGNRVPYPQGGWGGGILIYGKRSMADLRGNVVTGNLASGLGAGVMIGDAATATLEHDLIYGNGCPRRGGAGLYVEGEKGRGSSATVTNVTIAKHDCKGRGNGVYVEQLSRVELRNSIVWGNGGDDFYVDKSSSIRVAHSLTQERIAGTGNLSSDPRFANASAGDFHLRSTSGRWDPAARDGQGAWVKDGEHSPAIDRGDPSDSVEEEPAPHGGRRNQGAYGATVEASLSR